MRLKPCQNIGSPIERGALAEVTERSVVVPQTAEREGVILIELLTVELRQSIVKTDNYNNLASLVCQIVIIGTIDYLRIPIDW